MKQANQKQTYLENSNCIAVADKSYAIFLQIN